MPGIRTIAVALALVAFSAGQVLAHAELLSSSPAANATVTAPSQIVLHFSEAVNARLSGGEVTSTRMMMASKMTDHVMKVDGVTASLDPADHKTMILKFKAPLGAGAYRVNWHAVADDTHRETGVFNFTVR